MQTRTRIHTHITLLSLAIHIQYIEWDDKYLLSSFFLTKENVIKKTNKQKNTEEVITLVKNELFINKSRNATTKNTFHFLNILLFFELKESLLSLNGIKQKLFLLRCYQKINFREGVMDKVD